MKLLALALSLCACLAEGAQDGSRTIRQVSLGENSPNIFNVTGNVTITYSCAGESSPRPGSGLIPIGADNSLPFLTGDNRGLVQLLSTGFLGSLGAPALIEPLKVVSIGTYNSLPFMTGDGPGAPIKVFQDWPSTVTSGFSPTTTLQAIVSSSANIPEWMSPAGGSGLITIGADKPLPFLKSGLILATSGSPALDEPLKITFSSSGLITIADNSLPFVTGDSHGIIQLSSTGLLGSPGTPALDEPLKVSVSSSGLITIGADNSLPFFTGDSHGIIQLSSTGVDSPGAPALDEPLKVSVSGLITIGADNSLPFLTGDSHGVVQLSSTGFLSSLASPSASIPEWLSPPKVTADSGIVTGADYASLSKSISDLAADGHVITGWAITYRASEARY
jgi:hypothetical protein